MSLQAPLRLIGNPVGVPYDVTADGQRFLIDVPVTAATSQTSSDPIPITAVVNWTAALKK